MSDRLSRRTWRDRATSLAAAIPRPRLHAAALGWADASPAGDRWAVALSGGADSLALLLLVWAHWPERRRLLCALHFNHGLRGAAARGDAVFCRRVCRALGVPIALGTWRRRPGRGEGTLPSEALARTARFAFFEAAMARRGIRALWLGHQQDDVAESMLMRLARGSGAGGLAAPRPVQRVKAERTHVRPLLDLKKAEIVAALRAAGIAWREDGTNAGGDYFRNRIRSRVLPAWNRAAGRDALGGASRARELLEEDDAALETWVDRLRLLTPGGRLNLERLAGAPRAVARRALHRWLLDQAFLRRRRGAVGELSRQGFEALLEALQRGRPTRQSLGAEGFAVIRGRWLVYAQRR